MRTKNITMLLAAALACAAVLPRCEAALPLPPMLSGEGMPQIPTAALNELRRSGASLNLTLWLMQLAVVAQDDIASVSEEIRIAAADAGAARDAKAREAAWARVEAGQRKLFAMLDREIHGMKLTPADKLTAKKTYWRLAAAEIAKNEPRFTDPEAKKFFAAKKTIYEKKASVNLAAPKKRSK